MDDFGRVLRLRWEGMRFWTKRMKRSMESPLDTKSFTFIEVADALDDFFCSEGNWGGADMRARLWEVGKGWLVWETRRMESLTNSYIFG